MSHTHIQQLAKERNVSLEDWLAAFAANPNTPEEAIKVAIMVAVDDKDIDVIEGIAHALAEFIAQAHAADNKLDECENALSVCEAELSAALLDY